MKRVAVALAAVVVLAGCGSKKPDVYGQQNSALLAQIPRYPGLSTPVTSASGAGGTEYASEDWKLPRGVSRERVIDWYEGRLHSAGWRIAGRSFATLRAYRRAASVSVGVRGGKLEVIVNARGSR